MYIIIRHPLEDKPIYGRIGVIIKYYILGRVSMSLLDNLVFRFNLIKYKSFIKKQLNLLEEKKYELESHIKEVKVTIVPIPPEHLQNIIDSHKPILEYINNGNPYSFNAKLNQILSKSSHKKLAVINSRYKALSEKYISHLITLEVEIEKLNKELQPYYDSLVSFEKELLTLREQEHYITRSNYEHIKQKYQYSYSFFEKNHSENTNDFLNVYSSLEEKIVEWNEEFVVKELETYNDFFNHFDGKTLDEQQRRAVVVDEDNNLVVAGAGSGKTLTIAAKVNYLVKMKGIKPEEILLISFTRKAADEMFIRIKERFKIDIDVKTFHKLGLDIISKYKKEKPDVAENTNRYIQEFFNTNMYDNPILLKNIIEFFGYYLNLPKDLESFNNLSEYYDYHKTLDLESLKSKYEQQIFMEQNAEEFKRNKYTLLGEKLKSLEEVMIANFLFLNGIDYEYEKEYQYPTSNEKYRKYKPDFYLPEYDIYIEHFGTTKDERTPWLSEIEERKYIEGMQWKRELHKNNNTTLIETYSYLIKEGHLLETLQSELLKKNVRFKEVNFIKIFNTIYDSKKTTHFEEFTKFVSSFINLFKSNGFPIDKFEELIKKINPEHIFFYNRTKLFLEIVKEVYDFYESSLQKEKLIDFNDMINNATDIVRSGNLSFSYKYIIIDEYQDASISRFRLIKEIREITNAKVMCVGDDWQSIYRFTGADLNLFSDFEKHFGYSELLKIEKTHRNSQQLIDVASKFVMQNPKQIKKDLYSHLSHLEPIKIYSYTHKSTLIDSLITIIEEIVDKDGPEAEIMLIGRNNFDINVLKGNNINAFNVVSSKNTVKVTYKRYKKLKLSFLTAHKSKGLEAEHVILINTVNSLVGFPNKIADDPILSLVLTENDKYIYAEERRLFYVALTRTKNDTFILTDDGRMSVFIKELIDKYDIKPKTITGINSNFDNPKCPICVEGRLNIRENSSNKKKFLGCSNFPLCDYTVTDIKILDNPIICPSCKGYMLLRKGPKGTFYGCSNYKKNEKVKCSFTMDHYEENKIR